MKIQETKITDVRVLCPKVFGDNRGSFMEIWNEHELKQTGISDVFVPKKKLNKSIELYKPIP